MSYSGTTQFYKIPYMCHGDYLTESEEERRAKIIDNLLFVSTFGASKAIIEDANYSVLSEDGRHYLYVSTAGMEYVLIAIVNHRLAYREEAFTVELESEAMNYVYLVAVDRMDIDPTLCQIEVSDEPIRTPRYLLLAKVDCTGETPVLDVDTDKQYLTNIAAHTMDATNPHGVTLSQSVLNVMNRMNIRGNTVYPYVFHEIESSTGTTPTIFQIDGMTPVFVTPMIEDLSVGTVACCINGDNTISVTNSGSTGKKIVLKVEGVYE